MKNNKFWPKVRQVLPRATQFNRTFFLALLLSALALVALSPTTNASEPAKSFLQACENLLTQSVRLISRQAPHKDDRAHAELVNSVFAEVYRSPDNRMGNCNDNVEMFLRRLVEASGNTEILKSVQVLLITRPLSQRYANKDLISRQTRRGINEDLFHVVAEYGGDIFDLSIDRGPRSLSREGYFRANYVIADPVTTLAGRPALTAAHERLLLERINAVRLRNWDDALAQIQVEPIQGEDYFTFNGQIKAMFGVIDFFRNGKGQRAHYSLAEYLHVKKAWGLSAQRRENLPPAERKFTYQPNVLTRVEIDRDAVDVGDYRQTATAVVVYRNGQSTMYFNRTNRSIVELRYFYPPSMLDTNDMKGKVVVDLGMGGGLFVEELNGLGSIAFGIDLALSSRQQRRQYPQSLSPAHELFNLEPSPEAPFIEGDTFHLRINSNQVDVLYETYGSTSEEYSKVPGYLAQRFSEWHRVLKPNGVIRISPLFESGVSRVRAALQLVHGLKLTHVMHNSFPDGESYAIEIRRID